MAESNEHEQNNLNIFNEGTGSKDVEKGSLKLEENQDDTQVCTDSSLAPIEKAIDEEIAHIQAIAIAAAAKSVEGTANNSEEVKPNNLEIEAALNNTFVTDVEDSLSSEGDRLSQTQLQLASCAATKMCEEARRVFVMGQDLMETLTSTIEVLRSHVRAFSEKALEAGEDGTESGYRTADFYHTMTSKYEASVRALENRACKIEIALSRCEEAANECLEYAALAEEITDETLEESKCIKLTTCWWTNKARAAVIVTLKKEHSALLTMRRMWLNVRDDMENEERHRNLEDSSDEETPKCENRGLKTKIAHFVGMILGIGLLAVTQLFDVGSDSFKAILALGILTFVWCSVYWSHQLYKCLMEHDKEQQTIIEAANRNRETTEDGFLENCERRLEIVKKHLSQYKMTVDSDTESDMGSLETLRVGDTCQ